MKMFLFKMKIVINCLLMYGVLLSGLFAIIHIRVSSANDDKRSFDEIPFRLSSKVESFPNSTVMNRHKRQINYGQLRYETFNPCDDGFITLDRYIGLPFEEENYFNGTVHLEKYSKRIPHAELHIKLDSPATMTLDPKLARVRVNSDNSFYIRTHELPSTLNITVRAPSMKPFPNFHSVVLSGKTLCENPKKWVPTLLGPPPSNLDISKRFLLPEERELARSCGRSQIQHVALVTNSRETDPGEWPWHVAIYLRIPNTDRKKYQCGGSIISQSIIVTAAHCSIVSHRPIPPKALTVFVGKYNLNKTEPQSREYQVTNVIIHHRFSPRTLKNDIALYQLAEKITYNDFVQPVCLWDFKQISKNYLFGEIGTLVGWGSRAPHEELSAKLRSGSMQLVSDTTCLLSYSEFFEKFVSENTFCAGSHGTRGTSACNGDSGGGLFFNVTSADGEESWYLRGLVSVSANNNGTCDPNHYNVFTDVAQYLPWIRSKADEIH